MHHLDSMLFRPVTIWGTSASVTAWHLEVVLPSCFPSCCLTLSPPSRGLDWAGPHRLCFYPQPGPLAQGLVPRGLRRLVDGESQAGVLPRQERQLRLLIGLSCEGLWRKLWHGPTVSCGARGTEPGQCLPPRKAQRRSWRGWTWRSRQNCE